MLGGALYGGCAVIRLIVGDLPTSARGAVGASGSGGPPVVVAASAAAGVDGVGVLPYNGQTSSLLDSVVADPTALVGGRNPVGGSPHRRSKVTVGKLSFGTNRGSSMSSTRPFPWRRPKSSYGASASS